MSDFLRRAIMGHDFRLSIEDEAGHFIPLRDIAWPTGGRVSARVGIPALEVPKEPTPEPESASVVVLRGLLAERRAERDRVDAARKSRIAQAEDAERRAADLRKRIENDDTVLSVADEAIAAVLDDIAKLGGRPETSA